MKENLKWWQKLLLPIIRILNKILAAILKRLNK